MGSEFCTRKRGSAVAGPNGDSIGKRCVETAETRRYGEWKCGGKGRDKRQKEREKRKTESERESETESAGQGRVTERKVWVLKEGEICCEL